MKSRKQFISIIDNDNQGNDTFLRLLIRERELVIFFLDWFMNDIHY